MKRVLFISVILTALLFSACGSKNSIGIIGGADGPTSVVVSGKDKNAVYEKEPVRMVKIDGSLYYETDEDSELEARCGTLDGNLVKGAEGYEIPQNDGEANFTDSSGYQIGMRENTIEIPIDDDWEIFEKIDTNSDVLKYKYCYILEGTLPNAAEDSEYLVLANDMDVTFEEAAYKLLGSDTAAAKDIYVLPI